MSVKHLKPILERARQHIGTAACVHYVWVDEGVTHEVALEQFKAARPYLEIHPRDEVHYVGFADAQQPAMQEVMNG